MSNQLESGSSPRTPSGDPPNRTPNVPPETWEPVRLAALALVRPLEQFLKIQTASGLTLLAAAIVAMLWANSPWKESYHHLWQTPITLGFGSLLFTQDLHFWINDGLMVIFFFVVGLEIRREIYQGELSDLRRAALPLTAAIGGMLFPAGIYLLLNTEPPAQHGWGTPMATDIAFAVGILALLGRRVPPALRVLLLALAVIDDIGAILVIALFYSSGVQLIGFVVAALGVFTVMMLQRIGVRSAVVYIVPGVVIWAGMLKAGVHPTIAGVIVGLLTPARSWFGQEGFVYEAERAIFDFASKAKHAAQDLHALVHPLRRLGRAQREAMAPVIRLEAMLNPWVAFGIMPIFALANAGVTLDAVSVDSVHAARVFSGVALGLILGKPLGIVLVSLLAVRLGLAAFPRGVNFRGLLVVGAVGGVGFTMALFIANLAFSDPEQLGVAKLAVLAGSSMAALGGLLLGVLLLPKERVAGAAETAHEAERSTEM